MISKNRIKLINSLKIKKYRKKHQLFFCEGLKTGQDFLLSNYEPKIIVKHKEVELPLLLRGCGAEIIDADFEDLKKISSFKTPAKLIFVFKMPEFITIPEVIENETILYCDGIQDPGNFGTIIRTAAWFGIDRLVCSKDTADLYNPKVIQSGMGATAKVPIHYTSADTFFEGSLRLPAEIFAADMKGENIYESSLPRAAVIILGNEGQGIRNEVALYINRRLHIPHFAERNSQPESLNVAAATAIMLSEFKRRG